MKNISTALLASLFLILPFTMFGQLNYLKHYSNSGYDAGQGVVQLEDSKFPSWSISSIYDALIV